MDWTLSANRNGHIACTHGGESLAGLYAAIKQGVVHKQEVAIVDSTAHALKFSGFQEMYFDNTFPDEFQITPDAALVNRPILVRPKTIDRFPAPGTPLDTDDLDRFVEATCDYIATDLNLKKAPDS